MVHIAQVAELPDHLGALLGRADGVIQRHQAATAAGIHQECIVVGVEQQSLVTGQRQATVGLGGGHEDLRCLVQFVAGGQVDHRARGAQQPGQGYHQQQDRGAQQRAQAPWSIGVEGELPPQLVTVGHVLVGEQQQPDRRSEHTDAGHQVQRRERQLGEAARAIERATEDGQQAGGQGHQAGFFPVETLEQGQHGAHQQQDGGEHPGGRQAPTQALGQQQAEHADQAGAEVRSVHQAMGNQEADVLQAGIDFRGGAGEQQHHAGEEHQHREDRSRQARCRAQRLASLEQALGFVDQQQHAGHQHRQHDVDQSIQQQGRRQWRSSQLVGEGRQQDRLEHPDATRYMAEHPGGQGQQVDQQECAEGRGLGQ